MAPDAITRGELQFRFEAIDREFKDVRGDVKEAEKHAEHAADCLHRLARDVDILRVEMSQLSERTKAFTRALWSVAASLVVFTVSILAASGRFG